MEETKKQNSFQNVLNYLIKTTNGMAIGLFATLIIGVIVSQVGAIFLREQFPRWLQTIGSLIDHAGGILKGLMGIGIGIGVGVALDKKGIHLLGAGAAGAIGAWFPSNFSWVNGEGNWIASSNNQPIVAFLATIFAVEVLQLVLRKKTPVDIILVPLLMVIFSLLISVSIAYPVSFIMTKLGEFLIWATDRQPFMMGIIIAVVMGMILTAPISSAALAISIGLGGLPGGAAVVGCCVQMVGFAIMSRKDNKFGMVFSIGVGTSMLQFKNILKKPILWLPTILVSAILGPIATCLIRLECSPTGAGMGTSGLVGIIGTFDAMGYSWMNALWVLVLEIAAPILLVWVIDVIFRKLGWIKKGDLKV